MRRLIAALATAIAMGFGILTLWGLLVNGGVVTSLANILLQLVVLTAAVTILIGILNLIGVHFGRVRQRERNWGYSVIVILSTTLARCPCGKPQFSPMCAAGCSPFR